MKATVTISGIKELQDFLQGTSQQFNYKFMTGANKEAVKNYYSVMKAFAPVGEKTVKSRYASRTHEPGNLRDSIGIGLIKSDRKHAAVWCGPKAVYFGTKPDAYYAHMVEFGHWVNMKDGVQKWVSPNPFMRKTWDLMWPDVVLNIEKIYIKRINDYIIKGKKASYTDPWGSKVSIVEKD